MKRLFFYILISFLLFSCGGEKSSKHSYYYSVITFFENDDEYKYAFEQLKNTIKDTLIVVNDKSFRIGRFENYREACDKGFELFADKLIPNFDVTYKDSVIKNDYNPFYFVGYDLGRPALYKTDILKIKPQLIWSRWGREIMQLHRSQNRDNFFFTTSLAEDIRGNFPLVMDARLYSFNRKSEQVGLVKYFGRGLNLSAGWENDSTFAAYFTTLDSVLTSTIIQKKFEYNPEGELQDTSIKKYDLLQDGMPLPLFKYINPISPNLRYKIAITNNDSTSSLNIIDELNGTNNFIADVKGILEENRWSEGSEYLFARFRVKGEVDSTELYSVDLKEMKLSAYFNGKGEKNFFIIGNLLIFDNDIMEQSYITLYRYKKNQIFSEIKIPGGCGVNNLPGISKLN